MKRGRPPKFQEPRHPITVTLPESTLAQLAAINSDRSRAIVKAATAALPVDPKRKPVELVEVLPGLSVILIGPSRYIQKIKWLRLVEVAPLRFLLTIPTGTAVDSLELALLDLLHNLKPHEDEERSVLEGLRDLMRRLRVDGKLSKGKLLFVEQMQVRVKPDASSLSLGGGLAIRYAVAHGRHTRQIRPTRYHNAFRHGLAGIV